MQGRQIWLALRSIPIGWASLCAIVFLLERPLLRWTGPLAGAEWLATENLALDCCALAATGWVVGRLGRPIPMSCVLVFAATLTLWDLTTIVAIDIPWLLRLVVHALSGESSYFNSLVTTAASQSLLFGSLIAGGLLSRVPPKLVSII